MKEKFGIPQNSTSAEYYAGIALVLQRPVSRKVKFNACEDSVADQKNVVAMF